jgi:pimeloyl-ACP methyl ester carboxylesterase
VIKLIIILAQFKVFDLVVPVNHFDLSEGYSSIQYLLTDGYDSHKNTILVLSDALDNFFEFKNFSHDENFNYVYILGRDRQAGFLKNTTFLDKTDWERATKILSSVQHVRDIEMIRKSIDPKLKLELIALSSAGPLALQYATHYPGGLNSLTLLNPLIFDLQNNLGMSPLFDDQILASLDPTGFPLFLFSYLCPPLKNAFQENGKTISTEVAAIEFLKFYFPFWQSKFQQLKDQELIALNIKIFEHYQNALVTTNASSFIHPNLFWFQTATRPIEPLHLLNTPSGGIHYDLGKKIKCKIFIVGTISNRLINYHAYEALSELYPSSTLLLIKDNYTGVEVCSNDLFSNLAYSYLLNQEQERKSVFLKLQERGIIHQNPKSSRTILQKPAPAW